jgi:transcriptional regulator with XRE-family HTH domain
MPTTDEVGRRLKETRKSLGMTLKDVAEASGMSPTHISEIERGKTSPTVGALRKIAEALGKETAFFVEEEPLPKVSVVKKEDRETLLLKGDGDGFATARALTTGIPAGRIKLVLVDEGPGGTIVAHRHEGEEAIVIVDGGAKVRVGDEEFVLEPGDCLHYSARLEHKAKFTGKGRNKALWVKVLPGAIRW